MDFLWLAILILALVFYFLPTIVADKRNVPHSGFILFCNIFFGWTLIGWLGVFIWAVVEQPSPPVVAKPSASPLPVRPSP